MITLKLGEILDAEPVMVKLDTLSKDGKLDFKTTYKLGKLVKKIQPELQDFYEEKAKILKKYGKELMEKKPQENGEPVEVGTGQYEITDQENFAKYYTQLLMIDVELGNIFPFTVEELGSVKGFSTEDVIRLGKFVESNEPAEEAKERKKISINFED